MFMLRHPGHFGITLDENFGKIGIERLFVVVLVSAGARSVVLSQTSHSAPRSKAAELAH